MTHALGDGKEQMKFHMPLPHLDFRTIDRGCAHHHRRGMTLFQITADRDGLGNRRAVVQFEDRHPLQGIYPCEFGRTVLFLHDIDIDSGYFNALFRKENSDPSGVRRVAVVVQSHDTWTPDDDFMLFVTYPSAVNEASGLDRSPARESKEPGGTHLSIKSRQKFSPTSLKGTKNAYSL